MKSDCLTSSSERKKLSLKIVADNDKKEQQGPRKDTCQNQRHH